MWTSAPVIHEDEDEAALIDAFVDVSARYPDRDPFEIGRHVFRELRDPEVRSQQAVMIWLKDLDVLERISEAKRTGGRRAGVMTKEEWQVAVADCINDCFLTPQEKKARIDGYNLLGMSNGWIVKAVDKRTERTATAKRQIIFAQRND